MQRFSTRSLVLVAMLVAVLAVLSQIAIPLPSGVPITLQTFAVALCGFVLGPGPGALAVGVYLLMGFVGLPVFAGFVGGIGVSFGVTGGFLWGFLAFAALCGLKKPWWAVLGLCICHALGVLQFALVSGTPPWESFLLVSLPYLLKDAASTALACFASHAVRRGLAAARLSR